MGTPSDQEEETGEIAPESPHNSDVPRRSQRQRKLPVKLQDDYIMYRETVTDQHTISKSDWAS